MVYESPRLGLGLKARDLDSLDAFRGALSLQSVMNPDTIDRINYVNILRQSAVAPE